MTKGLNATDNSIIVIAWFQYKLASGFSNQTWLAGNSKLLFIG